MMSKSVWSAYCGIYAELGGGPVSAVDIMDRMGLSDPMARKVIWELKNRGLMKKVGREGREVKYSLISPIDGGARLALSNPRVRYRYVIEFFGDVQVVNPYVIATTALNYHAPNYAPILEIACGTPSELNAIVDRYPYVRTRISERIPSEWEEVRFEGASFRVASVEDTVIESYRDYPDVVMSLSSLDYMTAIALRAKGEALERERFKELPTSARNHIEKILDELDFSHDLREEPPRDVIEEEAERRLDLDPAVKASGMIERLSLPRAAVWLKG